MGFCLFNNVAIAAALECPERGCGQCRECRTAYDGTHADVDLVSTEGLQIKVDRARELVQLAARAPSVGRYRVIVVEDAGPGMPLPYRGRGYSGAGSSGLGLAIVHRVTEAAGGSVDLGTSSLGGLAVAVHLPVAEAAPARHEGAQG